MTQESTLQLKKIRRALISVSDKSGLIEFARTLAAFEIELISTGGTAKILREAGLTVCDVSNVTGFPEMLDGRVKTLHPNIHGGILAIRDNQKHCAELSAHAVNTIDLVVVNLYPFEDTINKEGVTIEEAIEEIDIGGPALIRSAAKNWRDVAVVVSHDQYGEIIEELKIHGGTLTASTREHLAGWAFAKTASYDGAISAYFERQLKRGTEKNPPLPRMLHLTLHNISDLRYGENPHQSARLLGTGEESGIAHAVHISGKEMSYNNYLDADAAWRLVNDFTDPHQAACAIIKHTNPAGVALAERADEAYRKALATDPVSAFGGIVALNCIVDEETARAVMEVFTEVIIAPGFKETALDILRLKKNLRILQCEAPLSRHHLEYRSISGGLLAQSSDTYKITRDALKTVTKREPTEPELNTLLFAWTVCKHTRSNAIVYAREAQTIGIGAGQMSRIDSVKLGRMRAEALGLKLEGSVLASDAFFPFRDGIDEAVKSKITAVIQPGGSVRDQEVIDAADEHGLAMVFTGVRHFKH